MTTKSSFDGRRKAQVSMEYLAIFSIAFMMTIPLIIIYAVQTQNAQADITNAEIYRSASKIMDSAEEVYFMGDPAQKTLDVSFPKGITEVLIYENSIIFNITSGELQYELAIDTIANLTGSIRSHDGPHIITFTSVNNQVVINDK